MWLPLCASCRLSYQEVEGGEGEGEIVEMWNLRAFREFPDLKKI